MGICAANMRSCDLKKRCQIGPNAGKAYSVKDPCCGVGVFSEAKCDCEYDDIGFRSYTANWSIKQKGTGRYDQIDRYTQPGQSNNYQIQSTSGVYYQYVYINKLRFVSTEACAGCKEDGQDTTIGLFQEDYILSSSPVAPEVGDASFGWCWGSEDCKIRQYSCFCYNPPCFPGCITSTVTGYVTARYREYDPDVEDYVLNEYLLFNDLDMEDPYLSARFMRDGVGDLPVWPGPPQDIENEGAREDCGCLS